MADQKNAGQVRLFISYSHADQEWLDRLLVHLAPLRDQYNIEDWSDQRIRPGSRWREEIRKAVARCNTALLLISADFLASDFIAKEELPPLLKAAEEEGALVIPIIVSPCLFHRHQDLEIFQAVNDPSQPLVNMSRGESEAVFVEVAESLLQRAADLAAEPVPTEPDSTQKQEDFLDSSTWTRLLKHGDWVREGEEGAFLGSGPHAYLLSRREYGKNPFTIQAVLSFSPERSAALESDTPRMNAGLLFAWDHEKANPRYYNVLFTGRDVLLERVGFEGGVAGADWEHVSERFPLQIVPGREYEFRLGVDGEQVTLDVDGEGLFVIPRPRGAKGRVGLRPWRSTVKCERFVVAEELV